MKKILHIFLVLFAVSEGNSQVNLILNPSFEDTVFCTYTTNYFICKDWINPNGLTTDYFSPYGGEMDCWNLSYKTPQTIFGFQEAQNGGAYIGLVLFQLGGGNGKEYAQGFLSQPLIANKTYYISFFINLADSSNFKTCEIDMAFTNELVYTSGGGLGFTENLMRFDISNVDSVDWHLLSGTYIANGGEKYMYIGSNTPNNQLNCIEELPTGFITTQAAYYFIDNIYVSENPLSLETTSSLEVKLYPNPADNEISILGLLSKSHYFIYDLSGNLVDSNEIIENKINTKNITNGFYYLEVNQKRFKILINHK